MCASLPQDSKQHVTVHRKCFVCPPLCARMFVCNPTMRRLLNQMAHAAAKQNGCDFQILFRRLLPRLGYKKAIWAVAHRICRWIWKVLHEGVRYVHRGLDLNPKAVQQKCRRLGAELRLLGYKVDLTPLDTATAPSMSM